MSATTAMTARAVQVVLATACPHCGAPDEVVKHGTNRSGSARCRCNACGRTFTPRPRPKGADAATLAAVELALADRLPHRAIARRFGVSFRTIRKVAAGAATSTRPLAEENRDDSTQSAEPSGDA